MAVPLVASVLTPTGPYLAFLNSRGWQLVQGPLQFFQGNGLKISTPKVQGTKILWLEISAHNEILRP